jgi:hypothetical protein
VNLVARPLYGSHPNLCTRDSPTQPLSERLTHAREKPLLIRVASCEAPAYVVRSAADHRTAHRLPGCHGHIGDGVFITGEKLVRCQTGVESVELALYLHRIAVDRIFALERSIGIEVAEPAAGERGRPLLPVGRALRD